MNTHSHFEFIPSANKHDGLRARLLSGIAIPAHPLALTASRRLDERRQRALSRYYIEAGSGGLAVGVHTTQFAIRNPNVGLYRPVLELAAETASDYEIDPILIAGVVGGLKQALQEATLARDLGYHALLLSFSGLNHYSEDQLIEHCHTISEVLPIMGFYLQQAIGGMTLSYRFWRKFIEIPNAVAIKIAPFNRYATIDVVRALTDSGRADQIALYTGNDDSILHDLLTPFRFSEQGLRVHIVGGLLGHWAVWTHTAVKLLLEVQTIVRKGAYVSPQMMELAAQVTDANAAFFDSANSFRGCIAGLHEVLRRQGLFEGTWCLDSSETLSPGQVEEIDRVYRSYPYLNDDVFVAEHRDRWLK
jgi:hypothetical protein